MSVTIGGGGVERRGGIIMFGFLVANVVVMLMIAFAAKVRNAVDEMVDAVGLRGREKKNKKGNDAERAICARV